MNELENEATLKGERADRLKRLKLLEDSGVTPYADKFDRSNVCQDIKEELIGKKVSIAGRIMLFRDMGKIAFAQLQDFSGRAQIVFRVGDDLSPEVYKQIIKVLDIGDFIGVEGEVFVTKKGEVSVMVKEYTFLSKALRPLSDKWHGLKDVELKYRKRYLDLIMNEDTKERFIFRSNFVRELRNFYQENGFFEVDTPVLCNTASGALARPFSTHHNALDIDVSLRIAPEIYLKEVIVGGFEKVFEIARVFRNEGTDPSHLQDFTMIEHYAAYWDYKMNMEFTEKMLVTIIEKLKGTLKLDIMDRDGELRQIDMTPPWKVISMRDIILKDSGIDIDNYTTADELREKIVADGISIDDMEKLGLGNLIDALYKEVSRKKVINPTFLINHPTSLSPLARKNKDNPLVTDRFQLLINGWEILNAYSELIDPADQKERFNQQAEAKDGGDEEALTKDLDYVEAMEYGMPPVSGWGMGLERILALLTNQLNLRDVVLFPLMRPEQDTSNVANEKNKDAKK
ncbi:MAG: lysine--tRNA ligase [Candidatus Moraniibacteriota bacterium]